MKALDPGPTLNADVGQTEVVCGITVPSGSSLKKSCLTTFNSADRKNSRADCNSSQVQLRGGVFCGELLRLELPGLCIDYGIYNLDVCAHKRFAGNCYTIGFLLGPASVTRIFDAEVVNGDLAYLPPHSELDVIVGGASGWCLLTFDQKLFERACQQRLDADRFNRRMDQSGFITKNPQTVKLLQFIRIVLLSEQEALLNTDHRHINQVLTDSLLSMCVDAIGADPSFSIEREESKYQRIVAAAEAYLNGHSMDPIKVSALALELDVSVRTLEYAFNEILGITPMRYLKIRRLNFVRQQLLREPQKTISHHASQAGFWHMAQFTQDYKDMFGETPSETLNKLKMNR